MFHEDYESYKYVCELNSGYSAGACKDAESEQHSMYNIYYYIYSIIYINESTAGTDASVHGGVTESYNYIAILACSFDDDDRRDCC